MTDIAFVLVSCLGVKRAEESSSSDEENPHSENYIKVRHTICLFSFFCLTGISNKLGRFSG